MKRTIIAGLICGYLLVLLDLTLRRFPHPGTAPNWRLFGTITHYLHVGGREMWLNVVGNVVAFLPLGFLLPALHGEWRSVVLATMFSFSLSLLIEALQYLSAQRVADVDDVLLNTLGGFLGYLAFLVVQRVRLVDASGEPAG